MLYLLSDETLGVLVDSFGRLAGGPHYAPLIHWKPLFSTNASRLRFSDLTQYAWPTHYQFPTPQGNHSRYFTNLLSFYAPGNEVTVGKKQIIKLSIQRNFAKGRIAILLYIAAVTLIDPHLTHGSSCPHESALCNDHQILLSSQVYLAHRQTDKHTQTTLHATATIYLFSLRKLVLQLGCGCLVVRQLPVK